jgi:hypothetical protein
VFNIGQLKLLENRLSVSAGFWGFIKNGKQNFEFLDLDPIFCFWVSCFTSKIWTSNKHVFFVTIFKHDVTCDKLYFLWHFLVPCDNLWHDLGTKTSFMFEFFLKINPAKRLLVPHRVNWQKKKCWIFLRDSWRESRDQWNQRTDVEQTSRRRCRILLVWSVSVAQ